MVNYQSTESRIVITETIPSALKVFLVLIGIVPIILAPYELLIRPYWDGFSIALLLAILFTILAIGIGAMFISAGIFGLNKILIVDKVSGSVIYTYQSSLLPLRKQNYTFQDFLSVSLNIHDWTDGPSSYGLQIKFKNARQIEIGTFENKNQAEQICVDINSLIL